MIENPALLEEKSAAAQTQIPAAPPAPQIPPEAPMDGEKLLAAAPAVMEGGAPAAPEAATPSSPAAEAKAEEAENALVIDLAKCGELKTIQALRNSGIIKDDTVQTELLIAKRLDRALNEDGARYSEDNRKKLASLQAQFRREIKEADTGGGLKIMAESGRFNTLLNDYMMLKIGDVEEKRKALVTAGAALPQDAQTEERYRRKKSGLDARRKKYEDERQSYLSPEWGVGAVKDIAQKYADLLKERKCHSTGRLAAASGAVHGSREVAEDLVNDVLGVMVARAIKQWTARYPEEEVLNAYAAAPEGDNAVRIKALAEDIVETTQPLSSLREFEKESPELDRITALKALLSAETHHALSQPRPPAELLATARKAQARLHEGAQAALSLSHHFLSQGPSAGDKRIRAIQANLDAEMEREGIALLPLADARKKAAELARASAEDLLQAAHADEKLRCNIKCLAEAAGVPVHTRPLNATPSLIGRDLMEVLKSALSDPSTILNAAVPGFVEQEIRRRASPALAAISA